ncbi:MAG TPA: aminotransferase class V-fold PLP-dependent enzyme [Rhodanobacteraceae bacterium]|nr:aminotransferase class V-fold PLP-dependent enzyme [Rhodanobacteraceae bacterium]
MTIASQRHLFDIPDDVAYFNAAYNAPQLRRTTEILVQSTARKGRPWERTAPDFFDDADTLRTRAAAVLGGDADGWAIVPAASYGLASAANAVQERLTRGDRIVLLAEEFPSNYYCWVRAASDTGARVDIVPKPEDGDWTRAVLARIETGVRVVSVPACHWTDGARVDLVAVGHACRSVGAFLVVDASQSLGALPLPLDEIRPDFLASAGYKWLLFPYGVSLLYVGAEWRGARTLEMSWLAREDAQNFAGLTRYTDKLRPGARRFDVGEACIAALPGAIAALEQVGAWSVPAIADSIAKINARIAAHLAARGFTLPPERLRMPQMFGARLPAGYRGDLVGALRSRSVYVSQRGESVRFSPHLHVSDGDVARLFLAIDSAL